MERTLATVGRVQEAASSSKVKREGGRFNALVSRGRKAVGALVAGYTLDQAGYFASTAQGATPFDKAIHEQPNGAKFYRIRNGIKAED